MSPAARASRRERSLRMLLERKARAIAKRSRTMHESALVGAHGESLTGDKHVAGGAP